MSRELKHLYQFGEFNLDKNERILRRGADLISLSPKAFDLLTIFVENPQRLIEKERLMKEIWADSFVEESNLTFNIGQLRKTLGDAAQKPIYIKTVPRHGYRFIAAVKKIAKESFSPKTEENIISELEKRVPSDQLESEDFSDSSNTKDKLTLRYSPKDENRNSTRVFTKSSILVATLLILSIVTVIVAANLLWNNFTSASNAPILLADYKSQQMTNAGSVYHAAISPNGKRMAYLVGLGGKTSIWLKQFDSGENTQIVADTDDSYYGLSFSNDGEEVFFSRGPKVDEARKINIYRVSILGGIPKEVLGDIVGLFSVSPDNRQISFVRCLRQETDFCSLFIADIDGKNERKLLTRPRPIRMGDNQFSPDGKSIAVALGQSRTSSSEFGLVEVDISSGTEREITNHKFSNIDHLRWLPDQSGILLTAYEPPNNSVKIFQVSTKTDEIKLLTKDSIGYENISLDKNASKMVTTQFTANFRLWSASVSEIGAAKPISQAAPPMYNGQSLFTYSSSGKLIYASGSDSNQHIWIMNADGSNQKQLTSGEGTNWQPRLSADEKQIVFASSRTGSVQIWRMNIDGSDQTQISEGSSGSRPLFVAADGKTIYFEAPKDSNLGKLSIGDDGKFSSNIISNERVFQPQVNPAGDIAAYFSRGKSPYFTITLMSLADGKINRTFPLADEKAFPIRLIWSPDGKSLFTLSRDERNYVVWKHSIETEKAELFANLGEEEIADISFSPDGKSFAFVRGKEFKDAFLIEGLK